MTSKRPYLIRALYDWIADNGMTPHIVVDASVEGTVVPQQYVRDGQIVLNVSSSAAHQLHLGNDDIRFSARFAGASFEVLVPTRAVLAVYARENGEGMVFKDMEGDTPPPDTKPPAPEKKRKPSLTVVK